MNAPTTSIPVTDRTRLVLQERELFMALARIERWKHDIKRGQTPPVDELEAAIDGIRKTLRRDA